VRAAAPPGGALAGNDEDDDGSDGAPSRQPPSSRPPSSSLQQQQQMQQQQQQQQQQEAARSIGFFGGLYKSLRDFGIGRTSIAEGGLGLFLAGGLAVAVGLAAWARGAALRTGRPYTITLEFPLACGITVGTPVRVRGVQVGAVVAVTPSLAKVDVVAEIADGQTTAVPLNSVVEANQSGLIAEPLVDITPQLPLPVFSHGPLDGAPCRDEGAIVCDGGRIRGQQGVALDDLVYVMTRMARQMDGAGLDKVFAAAEAATAAVEEATPLVAQAALLAEQATPLLRELREGGLLASAAHLTAAAASAAGDVNALQRQVMTDENIRSTRAAVLALCRTLQHVEGISADVGGFSRDGGVQRGVKTLVQALARGVEE